MNVAEQLLAPNLIGDGAHRPAVLYRGEITTYAELADRVQMLTATLVRQGLRSGDRAAVHVPNRPDFVVAWLALQWMGAIVVSIPPLYRRREIVHIVNHSDTRLIVSADDLVENVAAAAGSFDHEVALLRTSQCCWPPQAPMLHASAPCAAAVRAPAFHDAHRDEPALITYITSPDGPPRGAVQSRAEILAGADTYAREILRLSADDVCAGHPALSWAYGLGALLVFPLRVGAASVLIDSVSPTLPEVAARARATVLFCVPTMYRLMLRQPDLESFDLSALRCCVSSAEPLPAGIADEWRARTGIEILDGLGTTELGHIVISNRSGAVQPGSIGAPVPGYEARVVAATPPLSGGGDAGLSDVPDGTAGQLAVRGPTGCRYWRDSAAERRAVHERWSLTGDVCIRRPDGTFEHRGRVDDLIVSGGYKISPAEVRRALLEHPGVADATVFGAPDPIRGAVPKATVVPAPGAGGDGLGEELQQYLRRELAPYKCPREIQFQSPSTRLVSEALR